MDEVDATLRRYPGTVSTRQVFYRAIQGAVEPLIDREESDRVELAENAERESLDLVSKNWSAALAGALKPKGNSST